MTRDEISEQAARLATAMMLKQLSRSGANDVIETATDKMVDFYRATLNEAARAVCPDCAAGVRLLPQTAEWEYAHPDDDDYRYDCAACSIHDLIAALDKEGS